jgi:hypothetical protein
MPHLPFLSSGIAVGVDTPRKQERTPEPDSSKNALFPAACLDIT